MPHIIDNEAKTLDAAMEFLAHYETPAGLPGQGIDFLDTSDFDEKSNANSQPINLTHAFKHSHSLEIPEPNAANSETAVETTAMVPNDHDIGFDLDFCAVQALIDEVDGSSDFLGADSSASQLQISPPQPVQQAPAAAVDDALRSPTSTSTATPPVWMPRPARRKRLSRKEEIASLRSTVSELSDKLEKMRTMPTSLPISPETDNASSEAVSFITQSESLWEKVAARQLLLRQKSEADNVQLRRMMDTQMRQSKNLKRMLNRRSKIEGLEIPTASKRHKPAPPDQPQSHTEVFDELLRRAEEQYMGVDKLFSEKGMAEISCPGRKRQVTRNTINGTFVEFMDKQRVPFSLKQSQRAVWQMLKGWNHSTGEALNYFSPRDERESTDNSVHKSCMNFMATAEGVSAEVQQHKVVRKYAEAERAFFISEHLIEPRPTSGSRYSYGLKFWQSMTIRISKGEPLASGGETSVIESYLRATRQDEGLEIALQFRGAAYINVAVDGCDHTISLNNQEIENLLFDQRLARE